MDLEDFEREFFDAIMTDLAIHHGNAEEAFVDQFCARLAEHGEVENVLPGFWQKSTAGIKVNAYSYDEEDRRMALFVAEFAMGGERLQTISRNDVEKGLKRAVKFYQLAATGKLESHIEESAIEAYDLSSLIGNVSSELQKLDVYLLTNRVFKRNEAITLDVAGVEETQFHVWDIERLHRMVNEPQVEEKFIVHPSKDFGESFDVMLVPGPSSNKTFDCYVGCVPGTLLAKAYKTYGERLIERNVRSFLQSRNKVNRGIKETLQRQKEMFVAYNNGISTTAEEAHLVPVSGNPKLYRVDSLTGWQIVNGGQTTASLYHAWKDNVDVTGVFVQIKLTVLRATDQALADNLISNISRYANTQNKISFSDLGANDSFQVDLERVSRSVWAPDPMGRKSEKKWYYERATGQYQVELNRKPTTTAKNKFKQENPKDQLLTKTKFAKYYMAWEQVPHIVGKGNEANFSEFMKLMRRTKPTVDARFFKEGVARALLFLCCDKIVGKMDLPGYKANVVAYTLALASFSMGSRVSLMDIWRKQRVDPPLQKFIAELAEVTWNHLSNPPTKGTNISQWCKKEECWNQLKTNSQRALRDL